MARVLVSNLFQGPGMIGTNMFLLLGLLLAMGLTQSVSAQECFATRELDVEGQRILVDWVEFPDQIEQKAIFRVTLPADTSLELLEVKATMPAHDHDHFPTRLLRTAGKNGERVWLVDDVFLYMEGAWRFELIFQPDRKGTLTRTHFEIDYYFGGGPASGNSHRH